MKVFYAFTALIASGSTAVIAYNMTSNASERFSAATGEKIDYTNVVVILLTTVTVIFSVCAIALAILGVVGFNNLKRDAIRLASQKASAEIESAFLEGGSALTHIENEMTRDGHLKEWLNTRIKNYVFEFLPLSISEIKYQATAFDDTQSTDEGEVD